MLRHDEQHFCPVLRLRATHFSSHVLWALMAQPHGCKKQPKPVLLGRQYDHECQLLYRKGGLVGGLVSVCTLCCAADNNLHPPLNLSHTRLSHYGTAHAVRWPGHAHGGGLFIKSFLFTELVPNYTLRGSGPLQILTYE